MELFINSVVHICLLLGIGYYFITAMQWYSYRLERVVFHYNRYDWHFYFFLLPLIGYYLLEGIFLYLLAILFIVLLAFWYRKNDKKLVWTARIKHFYKIFCVLFMMHAKNLALLSP